MKQLRQQQSLYRGHEQRAMLAPIWEGFGRYLSLTMGAFAFELTATTWAQSGTPLVLPNGVTGNALVYEDAFNSDPSSANGEAENISGSSRNPPHTHSRYEGMDCARRS